MRNRIIFPGDEGGKELMMVKKLSLAVFLLSYVSGCDSPPKGAVVAHHTSTDLPSIRTAKSETLEKIKIGMPF